MLNIGQVIDAITVYGWLKGIVVEIWVYNGVEEYGVMWNLDWNQSLPKIGSKIHDMGSDFKGVVISPSNKGRYHRVNSWIKEVSEIEEITLSEAIKRLEEQSGKRIKIIR